MRVVSRPTLRMRRTHPILARRLISAVTVLGSMLLRNREVQHSEILYLKMDLGPVTPCSFSVLLELRAMHHSPRCIQTDHSNLR